ncbi:hypothetical protein ACTHQT_06210 [Cytobacillus praedii]
MKDSFIGFRPSLGFHSTDEGPFHWFPTQLGLRNIALKESLRAVEKEQIVEMIEQVKSIRSGASHLGLDHACLIRKMKCLGIRKK